MHLPKTYEPQQYEPTIYALWESSGAFLPSGKGEPYSVVMPPPNANGNLHIGHALTIAIEDILTRYYRMQGRDVVYIPGADHAGFETWVVYERMLEKEGKSRFDFSREQLYSQVWNFVDEHRGGMELQLRALGTSASWEHLVFTLDKKVIDTVYGTFKKLWDDKLIYRGERIVNYCTKHQTSFADIEVEHSLEKGTLWKIAYPLLDKIGEIVVATTRPETMLGDVAIAVHPEDKRYKHLIGTRALLPLSMREIPIIGDEAIDPTFGTGAVKITPAHDQNDFEIGERHQLEQRTIIDLSGKLTGDIPAQFIGLSVEEGRQKVLASLEAAELRRGEIEHEHSVGHCYKCGTIIQPLLKDQWFLAIKTLAQRAKKAVTAGEISFTPASKGTLLVDYFDNLRDWNLSRQIPWGIPIPAFQNINDPNDWIFDDRVAEAQITVDGKTYKREEDTFDTWFSSGQWPFITTDYLTKGDLSRFYPVTMLETGHDILNSWIARMILLGLYMTDVVPFKNVYLHGLVLDEHGQKMSKSKGNVVNPMEMVTKYGSDALRLGIVASRSAGQNQAFSVDKILAGRNFCNKLWNMARYIEDRAGEAASTRTATPMTIADHWVIRQLNTAAKTISQHIENHRFAEAAEVVYHTIWDDVADWYIEASKTQDNPNMLAWVLETMLRLAHPFAPFVTETIWETLAWEKSLLITATWPVATKYSDLAASEFDQLQKLVVEARFVASELPGGKQTLLYGNDALIADNSDLVKHLAKLAAVVPASEPQGLRLAVPNREAWLQTTPEVLYEHQTKLERRLAETRQRIQALGARLTNENYIKNAPKKIIEESRQQLNEQQQLARRLEQELAVL